MVVGNTVQLDERTKVSSFENFRSSLNGITILTYDELLRKIEDLIEILSLEEDETSVPVYQPQPYSDDIPF